MRKLQSKCKPNTQIFIYLFFLFIYFRSNIHKLLSSSKFILFLIPRLLHLLNGPQEEYFIILLLWRWIVLPMRQHNTVYNCVYIVRAKNNRRRTTQNIKKNKINLYEITYSQSNWLWEASLILFLFYFSFIIINFICIVSWLTVKRKSSVNVMQCYAATPPPIPFPF